MGFKDLATKQLIYDIMTEQKQKLDPPRVYNAPECEALELRVQGIICLSGLGAPGAAGLGFIDGDNINDYTDVDF